VELHDIKTADEILVDADMRQHGYQDLRRYMVQLREYCMINGNVEPDDLAIEYTNNMESRWTDDGELFDPRKNSGATDNDLIEFAAWLLRISGSDSEILEREG